MEYAVKAETHEGQTHTLRRGFLSRDAAEDHPVTLRLWKRVWIEEVQSISRPAPTVAPRPWTSEGVGVCGERPRFVYLKDANGRRIATVLGKADERELTVAHILKLVNGDS